MMDRDFVDRVGELSVLGDQATMDSSIEDPSNEKFFHFFFKVMRKLSEGMTQALHLETAAARPTDSPSLIFPPKTHAPSLLPGTHAPTNSPTATSSTASDPVLPIDGHVTPANPLETSMDDYENDPNSSVAGYRPMIESVNAVTVSGLSDKDNSISPPNTSTETIQPKVSSSSATPFGLPTSSPADSMHEAYEEDPPWFNTNYISEHSKGVSSNYPDCRTIGAMMMFCSLICCLHNYQ
jgi:hypothetical protein